MPPLRAIGVPSAASSVIWAGEIGRSDLDSGAVIASQPTSSTKSSSNPAAPRETYHHRVRPFFGGTPASPTSPTGPGPASAKSIGG